MNLCLCTLIAFNKINKSVNYYYILGFLPKVFYVLIQWFFFHFHNFYYLDTYVMEWMQFEPFCLLVQCATALLINFFGLIFNKMKK